MADPYQIGRRFYEMKFWQKFSLQYSIQKVIANWKWLSKTRREHVLIRYLFSKRFYHFLYTYWKDMVEAYYIKGVQEQSSNDVLRNRCSWRFCRIHRETPVLESLFNKVAGLYTQVFIYEFCEIFKNTSFTD